MREFEKSPHFGDEQISYMFIYIYIYVCIFTNVYMVITIMTIIK